MTSEAGHAIDMQYFIGGTKSVLYNKKKSSLGFLIFRPKIIVFFKKKVLTWNQSQISHISSQNQIFGSHPLLC